MTSTPTPATLPNTSQHVRCHEIEGLWFGLAPALPRGDKSEEGGSPGQTQLTWNSENLLGGAGIFFSCSPMTCLALGLGWSGLFFCYSLNLLGQHAAGDICNLRVPSSSSLLEDGLRKHRERSQREEPTMSRILFWSFRQSPKSKRIQSIHTSSQHLKKKKKKIKVSVIKEPPI